MKIISFMKYPKFFMMMTVAITFGLTACSGGAGDQVSLKSDALWEELSEMQKKHLAQKKRKPTDNNRIMQVYQPVKTDHEGLNALLLDDQKKDLIFKKIDKMLKDFSRAVLKLEKIPADDREFEMVQIEKLFSRFISEKMKWADLTVQPEDAALFTEKFEQAERLYGKATIIE